MKVLTVNGSAHIKDGCVDRALHEFERTIKYYGIEEERMEELGASTHFIR